MRQTLPIYVVAQCPGSGPAGPPLSGDSGRRLAALLQVEYEQLMDRRLFNITNVLPVETRRLTAGSRATGRAYLTGKLQNLPDGASVLLVGLWVASLVIKQPAPLKHHRLLTGLGSRHVHLLVIPHTSGRSRFWNQRRNRVRGKAFLTHHLQVRELAAELNRHHQGERPT